jgi:hypothetical protein
MSHTADRSKPLTQSILDKATSGEKKRFGSSIPLPDEVAAA